VKRLFCSIPKPENPQISKKGLILRGGAVVLAAASGSILYDYLSKLNMEKLEQTVNIEHIWDEEWDRYVRVPPELQEDIKEWFIAPDNEITKEREKYDEENDIGVREIFMIRHGQYDANGDLTVLGKEQANMTAVRLAQLLKGRKVRCIYHSDMPRAKQTAEEVVKLFPDIPVKETTLLAEAIPAEPNPPTSNCPAYIPAEGERLEKAFRSFFARPLGECGEAVDILVGHGNCFRFFVCRAMQIDPTFWLRMSIFNCGVSRVRLDADGRVSVRGVGDVGHLPSEKITYN
jgi:serine/threonine-protein phosphatase PGAM5